MRSNDRDGLLFICLADTHYLVPVSLNAFEESESNFTPWPSAMQQQCVSLKNDRVSGDQSPGFGLSTREQLIRLEVIAIVTYDKCEEATAVDKDPPHPSRLEA